MEGLDHAIESFAEVCLPDQFLVNMLYDLQHDNDQDLHSDQTFKWVQNYFKDNISVIIGSRKTLNLKQMTKIIPELHLDDEASQLLQLSQPSYAFPLGFEAKHQEHRPQVELLPTGSMYFMTKSHIQYLIYYENLSDVFKQAQKAMERDGSNSSGE